MRFEIVENKSGKIIVYTDEKKVALHCYPNRKGLLVYMHKNIAALTGDYPVNPRWEKECKNEHFNRRVQLEFDTPKDNQAIRARLCHEAAQKFADGLIPAPATVTPEPAPAPKKTRKSKGKSKKAEAEVA